MSNSSNDQRYFQSYDQFQVHELMLRDRPRVAAYHDAMMSNKHLFQDKVLNEGEREGLRCQGTTVWNEIRSFLMLARVRAS